MVRWLDCAGDRPDRWRDLYDEYPDFWTQFTMLFGKLISKRQDKAHRRPLVSAADLINARCTITGFHRAHSNRSDPIIEFFLAYIRIATHFLQQDVENLDSALEAASKLPDLRSYRHIRNLTNLFHLEQFFLGQMLREDYGIDPYGLRIQLAIRMLECPENVVGTLLELLIRFSENLESRPLVNAILKLGLNAVRNLLTGFCAQVIGEIDTHHVSGQLNHLSRSIVEAVQIIEHHLCEVIERQKADLVVETYRELIGLLCDTVLWAGTMNPTLSTESVDLARGDAHCLPLKEHPFVLRFIHNFKMLWTCISKGRMELRVHGVCALGQELVELWESRRGSIGNPAADPVIRSVAELLAREKVVEYIVSADSHPQLISRSAHVLSYSLVARYWTSDMTEAVWNTISLSQDSRIVAAVLEALNNSIHLAALRELLDFCVRMKKLPLKAFDIPMLSFVESLFQCLGRHISRDDHKIMEAYKLCVHLNREALLNQGVSVEYLRIHHKAYQLLFGLSSHSTDPAERQFIYLDCVHDVQDKSNTASGSLSSINAVLAAHKTDDAVFLTDNLDILTIVVQDLCSFASCAKNNQMDAPLVNGLDVRLQLLFETLNAVPTYNLEAALEEDLWRHLVGDEAIDDGCRELAFSWIRKFVQGRSHSHRFIDHCIQDYLPHTNSVFFTSELVLLIQSMMQYIGRVTPPPSPKEDQVVCDPLGDILWRLILGSSDDRAVQNSIGLLSSRQVDKSLFAKTSKSTVSATHKAVVERCIDQLKLSSSRIIQGKLTKSVDDNEKGPSTSTPDDGDLVSEEQRFIRTLHFLKDFLRRARSTSELHSPQQGTALPSPEMARGDEYGEDLVTLKYEANGKRTGIREFQIGAHSTYSDLCRRLQELTRFPEIFIIVGGQRIDLSRDPMHSIRDIVGKDRIIVGQPQGTASLSQCIPKGVSDSPAESAVLFHFNELYRLLDMDSLLGSAIFDFLGLFPPPGDIEDSIRSERPQLKDLFPMGKKFRTRYTLRTLGIILTEQFKSSRVDHDFVFQAVRAFVGAITDRDVLFFSQNTVEHRNLQHHFIEKLQFYLKHLTITPSEDFLPDSDLLLDRIWDFLVALKQDANDSSGVICATYHLVLDLSTRSAAFARNFRARQDNKSLHLWLLVYHPNFQLRASICNAIDGFTRGLPPSSALSVQENVTFYWNIIRDLLPELAEQPAHSRELLSLALDVLRRNTDVVNDPGIAGTNLRRWSRTMFSHDHRETPGQNSVNSFIHGYTRLLNASVEVCNLSEVSGMAKEIAEKVFDKFLYPDFGDPNQVKAAIPVLHHETRKEIFQLVLNLCANKSCFAAVALKMSGLMRVKMEQDQTPTIWEHSRVLRSPAGYVGLSNLTNTCYMNSLVSQLFMNSGFRHFMMDAKLSDARGSQKLLAATQDLFNYMEHTHTRFANTQEFANSIVPYDAPQIDVSIQMDVDEFYNLAFDRWEGQMITREDKDKFRSFYGGQLVTQIKSLDCDHVSERSEPFMTISCEVKGKYGLLDSLQAYVQGDAMEGDNKYKCEGCGRKLVNAIKKSCLRTVPDNLIFHLKRFDFDLTTFQRSKINDKFEFPPRIDMSPYKYEHLMQPETTVSEDWFDLVGILVHNGTAEAGHYYSYVRASHGAYPHQDMSWVEFNDADVAEFDSNKIPDTCFGGPWDAQQQFGWNVPKPWNAYMLFYRRTSSFEDGSAFSPPVEGSDYAKPTSSTADVERLQHDNDVLLRWFCLFDPSHAFFLNGMLQKLDPPVSEAHDEDLLFTILSHSCDYVHQVASKTKDAPDLEALLQEIGKVATQSFRPQLKLLDFFSPTNGIDGPLFDMVVRNPTQKARQGAADFLLRLVESNRGRGKSIYGVDVQNNTADSHANYDSVGILPRVMKLLADMTTYLGRYARQWDEYFLLWSHLVSLGVHETGHAISQEMFSDTVEILLLTDPPILGVPINERNRENQRSLARVKRGLSNVRLIQLISSLLKHLDTMRPSPESWPHQCSGFDEDTSKFPITVGELNLLRHVDKNRFGFILKVIDGWEKDHAPFAPGEIVRSLLLDSSENDEDMLITHTLAQSIEDYYLEALEIPLNMAVIYCQYCPDLASGNRMVQVVAQNAKDIDNHRARGTNAETKDQNGLPFISFFRQVMELNGENTKCVSRRGAAYYPYKHTVFNWAQFFAPALMVFDHLETRESTNALLMKYMCNIPQYDSETVQPSESDKFLAQSVRSLFDRCCHQYIWAWNARAARAMLEPLWITIDKCVEWMENVSAMQNDSRAYEALLTGEESIMMRRFHEVEDLRNNNRPDDDGEDVYGTGMEPPSPILEAVD